MWVFYAITLLVIAGAFLLFCRWLTDRPLHENIYERPEDQQLWDPDVDIDLERRR